MLTFKAKFVNHTNIKYLNDNKEYSEKKVSFVELNPKSYLDRSSFNEIKKNWKTHNNILNDIYFDMTQIKNSTDRDKSVQETPRHFYALTLQENKFVRLNPEKILGVSEYTDNELKFGYIDFIQVNPVYIKTKKMLCKYKCIGEALINSIIKRSSMKNIYLNALPGVEKFYKKIGFILVDKLRKNPLMLFKKLI